MNNRIDLILFQWLRKLNIPVSLGYLKQKLLSHPDYPSLLSITETIDELGIKNAALVVEKEKLNEIPIPFLAHTNAKWGEFILITNLKKNFKDHPDFEKQWNGVVVVAEKPEQFTNAENEKLLVKEKKQKRSLWLIIASIILVSAISLWDQFTWQHLGLFINSIAGIGVAILIVQHELGISNEFTEQLCAAGKNTDCDAVMKSKGSKFSKWFNWADAGIIYFSSVFLVLAISFFTGTGQSLINILSLLAVCALPFTFFSIYYQWQIVKKWCPLCLAIVSLLWVQFLLLLPSFLQFSLKNIFASETLFTVFIFITLAALWLELLKSVLQRDKELIEKNFSFMRLKSNPEIFKALLQQQRKVDISPSENDLQLGNCEAPLQIIVACSPYCGPCAKAHKVLHDLIKKNNIGLKIVFTVRTDNREDKKLQAVEYILQLLDGKDVIYKRNVLDNWYDWMDMEKFIHQYPLNEFKGVEDHLKHHEQWTKAAKINFTPTIFICGYELPQHYRPEDIKSIIRNIENIKETKETVEPENNYALI